MAVGKWFVLAIELAVVASLFTGALFSGYVSINSTGAPLLATIGPFVPVALLLGILIYVFREGGADG